MLDAPIDGSRHIWLSMSRTHHSDAVTQCSKYRHESMKSIRVGLQDYGESHCFSHAAKDYRRRPSVLVLRLDETITECVASPRCHFNVVLSWGSWKREPGSPVDAAVLDRVYLDSEE